MCDLLPFGIQIFAQVDIFLANMYAYSRFMHYYDLKYLLIRLTKSNM